MQKTCVTVTQQKEKRDDPLGLLNEEDLNFGNKDDNAPSPENLAASLLLHEVLCYLQAHAVVLPFMFWLKKIEKLTKVTLYAYLYKPNPPNSAK